jgi:L-seryl-tRNA(Ser) seleniumtransferase
MERELLKELGFKRTLNAAGKITLFGGSCPAKEVVKTMDVAAEQWVDMMELQKNSGRLLSSYLGCEDGIVTAGAFASSQIAALTALHIAEERRGTIESPNIIIQSPHVTVFADSFVIAGITLKEIRRKSNGESLSDHIDKSTIGVTYVLNKVDFEFDLRETVAACRKASIPTLVDAAAVDPVKRGINEILAHGPDAVSVSGGKGLNGPAATGILVGKSEFMTKAKKFAFPNFGPCRGMKVSKEEFAGLMMAVKMSAEVNEEKKIEGWMKRVEKVRTELQGIAGVRVETVFPWDLNFPQPIPRLAIFIETSDGRERVEEVRQRLVEGNPPILVRPAMDSTGAKNSITLDLRPLRDREVNVLAESLKAVLKAVTR